MDIDDEDKEESGDGNDNNGDETKTEMEQLYTELIQLKGKQHKNRHHVLIGASKNSNQRKQISNKSKERNI